MYSVIELQTNEGTTAILTNTFAEEKLAFQKYYEILSYASVSTIDVHAAVVVDCCGFIIRQEFFDRRTSETTEGE